MFKVGIRIIQSIFKVVLNIFPFKKSTIIDGVNSFDKASKIINSKVKNIFIVTGLNVSKTEEVVNFLENITINKTFFYNTHSDSFDVDILEGYKKYKENNCDAILAIGGGSVIDLAKGIAAKITKPNKNIKKFQGLFKINKKIPTFFVAPTTFATGSEATMAAVINLTEEKYKITIVDNNLISDFAILNPKVVSHIPTKLKGYMAMDVLTHAIEAYTNYTYTNKKDRDLCLKSIKLVHENLDLALNDSTNIDAHNNLLIAGNMAGKAFTKCCVGYAHAIGHQIGALYHVNHAYAVGSLLPKLLKCYDKKVYKRLAEIYDYLGFNELNSVKEKSDFIIGYLEKTNKRLGIENVLNEVKLEDIDTIIKRANKEALPTYPVPKILNKKEMRDFLINFKDL